MSLLDQTKLDFDLKEEEIDYDEEDLVIDETDSCSNNLTNNTSSPDKCVSDKINNIKEPKSEPLDEVKEESFEEHTESGSKSFNQIRSEILQEVKGDFLSSSQYSQYPYQHPYYQEPPPVPQEHINSYQTPSQSYHQQSFPHYENQQFLYRNDGNLDSVPHHLNDDHLSKQASYSPSVSSNVGLKKEAQCR